jgi:tyramine---L-glutamate ligase
MNLFVYEFVAGGGWYSIDPNAAPAVGLAIEGRAMLVALLADLASNPGNSVSTLRDRRSPPLGIENGRSLVVASAAAERAAFAELAAQADWTIVIAPEFQGFLAERSRWVLRSGGRLLGSSPPLIELAADKQLTVEYLARAGIPTPAGWLVEPGAELPAECSFPAVIKPADGAGSQGVRLLGARGDYTRRSCVRQRLERFCPGLAVSVASLCGREQRLTLPACQQRLTADGTFRYRGGRLPLATDLDHRARHLAQRVVNCLPEPIGYLGIDLVLGHDSSGSEDYVIEINPRLTTSYLGLRMLANVNLAGAMLDIAAGCEPALSFGTRPIEFAANGRLL